MQNHTISLLAAGSLCGLVLLAGCGKKDAQTATNQPTTSTATAETAPPAATATPPVLPGTDNATLNQAQAAWKAKEYDKAAAMLLQLQTPGAHPTADQAAAAQNQMQRFQRDLAGAAAAGDPNARAAIQRLRAASTPH